MMSGMGLRHPGMKALAIPWRASEGAKNARIRADSSHHLCSSARDR
jgi:hypothetical protein